MSDTVKNLAEEGLIDPFQAYLGILAGHEIVRVRWQNVWDADETHPYGEVEFINEDGETVKSYWPDGELDPFDRNIDLIERLNGHDSGLWEWRVGEENAVCLEDCYKVDDVYLESEWVDPHNARKIGVEVIKLLEDIDPMSPPDMAQLSDIVSMIEHGFNLSEHKDLLAYRAEKGAVNE
jgi:hypothetical protein